MKEIPLNTIKSTSKYYGKYVALVDDEDFESVSKFYWSVNKSRDTLYVVGRVNGVRIKLHHFIMGTKDIDHINHNTLDNRRSNLRKATRHQNVINRRSMKNGTSKFKGVHWYKATEKWQSQVQINGKKTHIGFFDSEVEAAKAYNEKAKEFHGNFAFINQV